MTDSRISSLHVYLTLHNHGLIHPTQHFSVLQYSQLQVERVSRQNHEAMAEKIGTAVTNALIIISFIAQQAAEGWLRMETEWPMAVSTTLVSKRLYFCGVFEKSSKPEFWCFFVQNITEPFKRSKPVAVNDTFTFISCFENVNPVNCQDWLLRFKPVLSTS